MAKPTPLLNIYVQPFHHEPAYIVGNREGLLALRDAINSALAAPDDSMITTPVFPSDGECYHLTILPLPGESVADDNWRRLAVPYTYEAAQ